MGKNKIKPKELHFLKLIKGVDIASICREANIILRTKNVSKHELLNFLQNATSKTDEEIYDKKLEPLIKYIKPDKPSEGKQQEFINIDTRISLRTPLPYKIYGSDNIEPGAIAQMENAMSLPVSKAGALMADAHKGYGLPIGGVLATPNNVVIPYAVGVDIACRMCLSVFAISPEVIHTKSETLKQILEESTIFGVGSKNKKHIDTSVFDKQEWSSTKIIRKYRDLAYSQLGTSGGGNHFAEWGELTVNGKDELLGLEPGAYLALLTHSGSRGFGSEIALYYSKLAMSQIALPGSAKHLAWLYLDTQEGIEYWIAMNLAGEYASANHHEIHRKVARALNEKPLKIVENHHNFAWEETLPNGEKVIVHRKGATPAYRNSLGIIPGTMVHRAYVVRGKGNYDSLFSASHGAGRQMSRKKAIQKFTRNDLKYILDKYGVKLIGGGLDEVPMAYKDIGKVMNEQKDLVEVLAQFQPKIVRMANPERKHRWE